MSLEKNNCRSALITGAVGGIGRAIAKDLSEKGHPLILIDKDPSVVDLALSLQSDQQRVTGLVLDISDQASVMSISSKVPQLWQQLAIVVNNAGISPKHQGKKREVQDMPLDEWEQVLKVNLTGTFLVTKACLGVLKANGWGRIVMITSMAARTRTVVPGAHYSATKAGMTGFARVLAGEVAHSGITVNCVAPGRIESAMTAAVSDQVNAQISSSIPVGRMGRPDEVASAVAFLISDGAAFITGTTIDLNGGGFMS